MKHTWKKAAAFVLATALVAGVVPANVGTGGLFSGTGITAYAAGGTEVTKANVICQQYSYYDADNEQRNKFSLNSAPPIDIVNITLADAQAFGAAVTCPTTYWVLVYEKDGDNYKWTSNGKTGEQASSPYSSMGAWDMLLNNDVYSFSDDPMSEVTFYFSKGIAVTGVTLDKTTVQTITVGENVAFTASISPDTATDKTVKWSASNANVKLYSDSACTTEVGTDATSTLTVYAKGITAGNSAVTVTSNADATKTASCDVTVNAAAPKIYGPSVTLGDDLALNIYVDGIADDTEAAEYIVNFTGACVDESSTLAYNATVNKYYATTHVYAKDINKNITATLCKGSDTVDTLADYSISQYLSSDTFSAADEKTTALITATKDFGNASAEYFYGTGSGYSDGFTSYNPDVTAYATTFDSEAAKISLVLDSKTAARLYVAGDTTGEESTVSATKADYPTYHEVTGLLPQNLADEQTITVGGTDYTFSALSWCNRVLNSTSASEKNVNMAKAIVAYYTAAKNYTTVDVSSVTITNAPTDDMTVGDTATLSATVSPDNATDKTVTWSSNDSSVVSVNATTGEITAVGAGTATITATAGGKTDTCTITVKPSTIAVTSITIDNAPTEALFVNSTGTLTATVSPDNATDKTVVWSSSDPDYVSINAETGEYTVMGKKGYGSATITATATNGTEDTSDDVTATCTITGKVTYTSLSVGTVLHTGDTFYTGSTVFFQGSTNASFTANMGVITIIEATKSGYTNKYYQCQRGSNGTYPNWSYVVKDNTDGIYITGGSGTSSNDRFTLDVHTKE